MSPTQEAPGAPRLAGIFSVKFPVSDLARACAWYERLFDLVPFLEFPDEDGVVRGIAYRIPGLPDVGLALRENPRAAGLSGFDPVSFAVEDRAAVDAWSAKLTDLGIEHEVAQATVGWILVFHDPDGTEIHFYSLEPREVGMAAGSRQGRPVAASA
jgi:catechol 2,3-dioxygenase-like lactoylglutathione lyase family enzyme